MSDIENTAMQILGMKPTGLTDDNGEGTEYTLEEGSKSCWITVNDVTLYIRRTENGVCVEAYDVGCEMDSSLNSMTVFTHEGDE